MNWQNSLPLQNGTKWATLTTDRLAQRNARSQKL